MHFEQSVYWYLNIKYLPSFNFQLVLIFNKKKDIFKNSKLMLMSC